MAATLNMKKTIFNSVTKVLGSAGAVFLSTKEALAYTAGKQCSVFSTHNNIPGGSSTGDPLAFLDIGKLLEVFVTTIILFAGIGALLYLAIGGFQYLTSGGDKTQAQSARERITYAIIGLVIVVSVVPLIQIVSAVFGINVLGNIKFPGASAIVGELFVSQCTP